MLTYVTSKHSINKTISVFLIAAKCFIYIYIYIYIYITRFVRFLNVMMDACIMLLDINDQCRYSHLLVLILIKHNFQKQHTLVIIVKQHQLLLICVGNNYVIWGLREDVFCITYRQNTNVYVTWSR